MQITNVTGIDLPLAVWLAADDYDFVQDGQSISATALLKPVRQILLKERLTRKTRTTPDVADFIASRLGHSIHDGIEKAWKNNYRLALKLLGYPDQLIERIRINPTEEEDGIIPVWLEQRSAREIKGYRISGKFDMVLEGALHDFKSTSVFAYTNGSKDEDYILQGSIYRWIHQDKVTEDQMTIQFIFTDWQKAMARSSNTYPQQRVMPKRFDLLSLAETEAWILNKLEALEAAAELDEADLPRCTDKDLWRGETVYKYYSNPEKVGGRATKNFDNLAEANAFAATKGKGIVVTVPGQVKACSYCPAFPICTQKDEYEHA
jgi:hypothetical protein